MPHSFPDTYLGPVRLADFDHDGQIVTRFRKTSRLSQSSDEFGLFLRSVLRENGSDPADIGEIAVCSVVPEALYSVRSCCRKYFAIDPFVLRSGVKTGLRIKYRNPLEVGADRIANAIGAIGLYPDRNVIVVDMGTATTFDVVSAERDYLGGLILPGIRIAMESLDAAGLGLAGDLPGVESPARAPSPAVGHANPTRRLIRLPPRSPQ